MAKKLKLHPDRLKLQPKIQLYGKKIELTPKLSKKHYEALRERLRQPNEPT